MSTRLTSIHTSPFPLISAYKNIIIIIIIVVVFVVIKPVLTWQQRSNLQ